MPYYQRIWNVILGGSPASTQNRKVRTYAVGFDEEQQIQMQQDGPPPDPYVPPNLDATKVTFLRQLLNRQVEEIQNARCTEPIRDSATFLNYEIDHNQVYFKGMYSTIFACKNAQYGGMALMCRVFEKTARINPQTDLYLKILRHLSKKHPSFIATMDIFVDENAHIYLMQEFATLGNAMDYIRTKGPIREQQLYEWAQDVYCGMDFLGDNGISHSAIQPKHIKLKQDSQSGRICCKLSGFRSAILYWDPTAGDIVEQPCRSLEKRMYASFFAPETYGASDEYYNPIEADVWSYGATFFYFVTKAYPYNPQAPEPALDTEIRNSIASTPDITDECKYWLYGLMRPNTAYRTSFDAIPEEQWFKIPPGAYMQQDA